MRGFVKRTTYEVFTTGYCPAIVSIKQSAVSLIENVSSEIFYSVVLDRIVF